MNTFGIENPHEGDHVPGPTCPACAAGYPKPCASPSTERVLVGKVAAADMKRMRAQSIRCPGFIHGDVIEGQTHQRCDTCGIREAGGPLSMGGETHVITPADVAVVSAEELLGDKKPK